MIRFALYTQDRLRPHRVTGQRRNSKTGQPPTPTVLREAGSSPCLEECTWGRCHARRAPQQARDLHTPKHCLPLSRGSCAGDPAGAHGLHPKALSTLLTPVLSSSALYDGIPRNCQQRRCDNGCHDQTWEICVLYPHSGGFERHKHIIDSGSR